MTEQEIDYEVSWADFEAVELSDEEKELWGSYWNGSISIAECPESKPSNVIDDRTIQKRTFKTEEEALSFAQDKLEYDKKWRAYVLVNKRILEIIKRLK